MMDEPDPLRLARRQIEIDRQRTRRFPDLLARKLERMAASPLAFLRGSAPLFYELLGSRGELGAGPSGEGWIVGDAHLENFGAFGASVQTTPDAPRKKRVEFNLNDFDEATRGFWRWDVLRLATSVLLAGRELGVNGAEALELSETLIESYAAFAFGDAPIPQAPAPVVALLERVQSRSRQQLLDDRTKVEHGRRRFVRGERYRDLPRDVAPLVPGAFAAYVSGLEAPRPAHDELDIVDCAMRIAGTGSLGVLRIAIVTRGKGGADGGWLFDMKEQLRSSADQLAEHEDHPAERTAGACRACIEHPPRMLGTTKLGDLEMLVRRLTPQEDKLNLRQLKADTLTPLALYLGALLARAHVRGAQQPPPSAWSKAERFELLQRAVALAGLHEATYLELCLLSRGLR